MFRDVKSKEVKSIIYKPVILQDGENLLESISNTTNFMDIDFVSENTYRLKITLPDNLKYPVKINQSFHLYKPKQPDSAIYSNSNVGYYLNDKVILGYDTLKGEGQLLIRFEALDLLNINPQDIISAKYIISEISGTSEEATIAMYPVLSEWCSLNTRWSSKPVYAEEFIQRITVTKGGDYSFDVTEPLKKWLQNRGREVEYIIRHGFVLVNETPKVPKIFATGDNGMFTSCLKINLKKQEN